MRYSGFYMVNASNKKDAKKRTEEVFQREITNTLNEVYGEHLFMVTDVLRREENDEDNGLKSYDVHFILNLPYVSFKEDTKPFYNLEKMVYTGYHL